MTKVEFKETVSRIAQDMESEYGQYAEILRDFENVKNEMGEHDSILASKVLALLNDFVSFGEYVKTKYGTQPAEKLS